MQLQHIMQFQIHSKKIFSWQNIAERTLNHPQSKWNAFSRSVAWQLLEAILFEQNSFRKMRTKKWNPSRAHYFDYVQQMWPVSLIRRFAAFFISFFFESQLFDSWHRDTLTGWVMFEDFGLDGEVFADVVKAV